jgi:hypothetical protein
MNNSAYIIYVTIYLHTKFQMASANRSLITTTKLNAKHPEVILFYILQINYIKVTDLLWQHDFRTPLSSGLLNHKAYISTLHKVDLKMIKATPKSNLLDKIQCKSTVLNLIKLSYVIWAMFDVEKNKQVII